MAYSLTNVHTCAADTGRPLVVMCLLSRGSKEEEAEEEAEEEEEEGSFRSQASRGVLKFSKLVSFRVLPLWEGCAACCAGRPPLLPRTSRDTGRQARPQH